MSESEQHSDLHYNIFGYDPSIAGIIVSIVLFGLVTLHQMWVVWRHKCWFWSAFITGGVFEVIGYLIRIASKNDPGAVGPYAAQTLFILLPPALFAASIYMTLGRLLRYIDAEFASLVRTKWMTRIFVTGDVLSFIGQGAGGGLQGSGEKYRDAGSWVVIAGLAIQLLFFCTFVVVALISHYRLRKANWSTKFPGKYQWPTMLYTLYAASILILIRSVFRVIEFADGYGGSIMTKEIYMYMFDALLMFICMCLFSIVHPAYVMVKDRNNHEMSPIPPHTKV